MIWKTFFAFLSLLIFFSCSSESRSPKLSGTPAIATTVKTTEPAFSIDLLKFKQNVVTSNPENILCMFQDRDGNYWFGTETKGAFLYNDNTLMQFTSRDGLFRDQVLDIQQDKNGNIYFSTGAFGVTKFDGEHFTTLSNSVNSEKDPVATDWQTTKDDLWFSAGGGVYHLSNNTFNYLPFPAPEFDASYKPHPAADNSAYGVYKTFKDSKDRIWIGTQTNGVCCFDGSSHTWFRDQGLAGPAIRAIFEDREGNMWFGNNGNGLFRYDGSSLTNITNEHNVANQDFQKTGREGPGTLARVFAISQDYTGKLWMATPDAGVWSFEAGNLSNFTSADGLSTRPIEAIFSDQKNKMWFCGDKLYQTNGLNFSAVYLLSTSSWIN